MPTKRQKPIEPLTEEEVKSLLLAASAKSATGLRGRALVALLAYAGLRISEALAVLPKDVDLEAGVVAVLRGKGHRQRVAAILPEAEVHLERWAKRRERAGLNGKHPFLCTISRGERLTPGAPLHRGNVRVYLGRLKMAAGIDKRVHPHGLRHSHAHMLAARGKLVTDIRDQLGHASLHTTTSYLDSFAPAGRVERLRA